MSSIYKVKSYPSLSLYEEIIFLTHWFKGNWVVENVRPYYKPLVAPVFSIGRHLFWSNKKVPIIEVPSFPNMGNFNSSTKGEIDQLKSMLKWLQLPVKFDEIEGKKRTVIQNCVHPSIGSHIFKHLTV